MADKTPWIVKKLGWYKIEPKRYHKNFREAEYSPGEFIGVEWSVRCDNDWVGYYTDDFCGHSDSAYLHFALWPVQVWFRFEPKPGHGYKGRRTGFSLSWNAFQLWRGCDPDGDWGDGAKRTYWNWRDKLWDALFGRTICAVQKGRSGRMAVTMPEGDYPGTYSFETRIWTRPRWLGRRIRKYTECSVEGGIPHSGKGENSWDCGDDGLWGWAVTGHDVEAACAKGKEIVMKQRKRYGEPSVYGPWPAKPSDGKEDRAGESGNG